MHPSLEHVEHRPWPLPSRRWAWRQSWCDLLFAHWRVEVGAIRPLVPSTLEIETFDGSAWVGVVPFRMQGVSRRGFPDVPGLSAFPELNVRTYVRLGDRSGVWFFSLDATNRAAVWAGRSWFHLPYFMADISIDARFSYRCRRRDGSGVFALEYEPTGPVFEAVAGSLEHWLTERYCLYAEPPGGRLFRTEVHHRPWPLRPAAASFSECRPGRGVELSGPPEHLLFSDSVDVVAWSPEEVA